MEYNNDQNFLKRSEPINEIIPTKKSRKSITLLIIAASRRARGICYIGLSFEEDCLYRPIYSVESTKGCWPIEKNMQIGSFINFWPCQKINDISIEYPHQNNDILVEKEFSVDPFQTYVMKSKIYQELLCFASTDLESIFQGKEEISSTTGKVFIEKGVNCPSCGILKVKSKEVMFKPDLNSDNELLVVEKRFKFTWTSLNSWKDVQKNLKRKIERFPEEEVLIVLSLGRGFNPEKKWQTSRCYCLAVGLILREEEDNKMAENIISSQHDETSKTTKTSESSNIQEENEIEEEKPKFEDLEPIQKFSKSNSSSSIAEKQTSIKDLLTPKKRKQASILDYYTASKKFGGNQNR